ncbi:MAG: molybdopterin biosynthesis protein [Clostridiales bacterium GWB2_37_7]|nr:MAG: molybdopterin biosynthesis protein [Clostridiales bacterium GWB2_37_7]
MVRNIYLSNMEVENALALFTDRLKSNIARWEEEETTTIDSLGRVTSKAIFALVSSPNYNASAMDGIAVKAKTTFAASEVNPVRLKKDIDFIYVDTGDPILDPFDAVIMIEDVVVIDDSVVEIIKAAAPWQDIRPIGEDIVANEMIIPSNHMIRPVDMAAMLAGGVNSVKVYKKPKVGLIPTGTEIIEPGEPLSLGSIIESNSRMFEGLVKEYGGQSNRTKPIPDDYQLLKSGMLEAVNQNDMVIINAGSSAGSEDYTVKLIAELGEVLVHGIATKPGKPAILGIIQGKPVIGIPGYPVSAYFVFENFVKPVIKSFIKQPTFSRDTVEAVLSKRVVSSLKHREYVRIKLGMVDDKLIATPLSRGAGATMSLVRADGILVIPQNSEGAEGGEAVQVELLKNISEIRSTVVSIGSHDIAMDIMANLIHQKDSAYSLSSAHVGSMGGIMALRRGETHIAPIHLLDEASGIYNLNYLERYLPNKKMALIKGLKRIQGIMVKKGNPKNIKSFEDLVRDDIQFVNRQKGAGTRILMDYLVVQKGLSVEKISGYEREMTTHMAVAAAVDSGSADAGLGVLSAAKAMDLDFIPIGEEDYDFAVPVSYLKLPMIELFLSILKSEEFAKELEVLGGYSLESVGEIVYI